MTETTKTSIDILSKISSMASKVLSVNQTVNVDSPSMSVKLDKKDPNELANSLSLSQGSFNLPASFCSLDPSNPSIAQECSSSRPVSQSVVS